MSYTSESILREDVKEKDIQGLIELLGYKFVGSWDGQELGKVKDYFWFDNSDYKSINGVELSYFRQDNKWWVSTRSTVSRSYYDLIHQNKTIRFLKKYFGGQFRTDEGKGRYLQAESEPPEPASIGCHIAFQNFGSNLIRARQYFDNRTFKHEQTTAKVLWMDLFNPRLVSNNLILPFLVSISEDYWKSTYVALLKYSENKEFILKSSKISADRLMQISNGELNVEQAFADSMSFARISIVCRHFKELGVDFASTLRKPYRKRKVNLFDSLETMTDNRNVIIHEASKPLILDDNYIKDSFNVLHDSIERCYKELTKQKKWTFDKGWAAGGRLK